MCTKLERPEAIHLSGVGLTITPYLKHTRFPHDYKNDMVIVENLKNRRKHKKENKNHP